MPGLVARIIIVEDEQSVQRVRHRVMAGFR